jgi:hypothetical protein
MAEFRAIRSDGERMLHLRARTFVPLTGPDAKPLESVEFNRHENPWFGYD